MRINFVDTGNLGETPALKMAAVKGKKDQPVTELSIYFDKYKPVGEGENRTFERAEGGFWMNGSVWGKQAEDCARVLRKGSRVHVEGELFEDKWNDKTTGEQRSALRLKIDKVYPTLGRIESVKFRESADRRDEGNTDEEEDAHESHGFEDAA